MLWLVPSHEAGHGAGYVTVWTRHVTHVTLVTWIYLYSSDHIYRVDQKKLGSQKYVYCSEGHKN